MFDEFLGHGEEIHQEAEHTESIMRERCAWFIGNIKKLRFLTFHVERRVYSKCQEHA